MNQEFLQLLSRIDERTENIEQRQLEEIEERKALDTRVNRLENWQQYILGALAVVIFGVVTGIQYLENKFHGH